MKEKVFRKRHTRQGWSVEDRQARTGVGHGEERVILRRLVLVGDSRAPGEWWKPVRAKAARLGVCPPLPPGSSVPSRHRPLGEKTTFILSRVLRSKSHLPRIPLH